MAFRRQPGRRALLERGHVRAQLCDAVVEGRERGGALLQVEGTLPHYQIVLTRERGLDEMEVQVEVTPEVFSDTIGSLEGLKTKLEDAIDHVLGLRVKVHLVAPRTIARSEGKAKRVQDQRNI